MRRKYTVTIGIPVYNEGANIARLLKSLYAQKTTNILIKKIIVSSDGSSDDTVKKTRALALKKMQLVVINNKDRKGIARGLNQIIMRCSSDILVTLDGDIQINDKNFIEKLVTPIYLESADLTSSSTAELRPISRVSKALFVSMQIKRTLFHSFRSGNNLYTCFGLARGYSKRFYKRLKFKVSIGNDMYSYLACITCGYSFMNAKAAVAYYRLPESFIDHKKQSTRFVASPSELSKYFDKSLIQKETTIPFSALLKTVFKIMPIIVKAPLDIALYAWIQLNIKLRSKGLVTNQAWDMATSSKHL